MVGGENMQQAIALNEADTEQLAAVIVELIKRHPKVRSAVMECAYNTPGLMTEY